MEQRIPEDSDSFEKDKDTMEFFENGNERESRSTGKVGRPRKTLGMCDELSPQSRRKAMNRLYCQENRRKKKEYVKELEEKVEDLEKHIENLNDQIEKYRFKLNLMMIGGVKDLEEFNETHEIKRTQTIKSLEEGKEGDQLKKNITEFCKTTGLACNDRQRLIKSAIRIIIDNVVPSRLRILFNLCSKVTNTASFN